MTQVLPPPLSEIPISVLARIQGVMTDIDDTLTRDGVIEPAALQALHSLRQAQVPVVAITGRPLGWSLPFARQWPLSALVAENGAVALLWEGGVLHTEFAQDEVTRTANLLRLQAVTRRVLQQVPGATLARDSPGRVTDIAIDHAEFVHLSGTRIAQVLSLMQEAGMNATVSSIHINGWYGEHDKWTAAQWMVQRLFGRSLSQAAELQRWLYVGDSTNDQLMFQHFALSVGVANLKRFAADLRVWPSCLTAGERGQGFAELSEALLAARAAVGAPTCSPTCLPTGAVTSPTTAPPTAPTTDPTTAPTTAPTAAPAA